MAAERGEEAVEWGGMVVVKGSGAEVESLVKFLLKSQPDIVVFIRRMESTLLISSVFWQPDGLAMVQ